jgi:hypothetical protein
MLLGWLVGPPLLALVAWLPLVGALRRGRRGVAVAVVALWAALLAGGTAALEVRRPGSCAALFPRAAEYREEMLTWARNGEGCESSPACFVPQHLLHAALFAAATVATSGYLGLVFASVLFGWMGAYAGGLAATSGTPLWAAALAWHPWAVVRVAAYLALGVALAEPLIRLGLPRLPGWRRWLLAGLAGLAVDIVLKALLAPWWWARVIHPLVTP